jgi:HEAT repeat protein
MAIGNLRFNRTDEAVKTLKTLLHDPEQQISSEAKQAICAAYRSRDGARGRPFRADDFDATEITPLIQQWLASGDRNYQYDGLDFAAIFGDDALTPKLIALATNPKPAELGFRYISIKALAMNRTDEAVATLKTLLNDPDPRISQRTEQAISRAYTSRDGALGKPLRPDDFDAKFQPPAPAPATNPAPTNNSGAIPASARDQASRFRGCKSVSHAPIS